MDVENYLKEIKESVAALVSENTRLKKALLQIGAERELYMRGLTAETMRDIARDALATKSHADRVEEGDTEELKRLRALINNPQTEEFLSSVKAEAAHQRDKWGDAHDRGKSAENWFWLVGYLTGKCLRAVITGDKKKALHHTISSAAALANWYEAIKKDETGCGVGHDNDIKPVEIEAGAKPEAQKRVMVDGV